MPEQANTDYNISFKRQTFLRLDELVLETSTATEGDIYYNTQRPCFAIGYDTSKNYTDDYTEDYTDTYTEDLRSRGCSQLQKRLPIVDYYRNLYYICHITICDIRQYSQLFILSYGI